MKRRFYALMLVVAMLAMTLVACGSDTNDTTNTTNDVTVNTEVEESGDDVVVEPTEEPTATPEVEEPVVEPTEEPEVVEPETPEFAYAFTWAFPDGMDGFTQKFLNEDYPEWSVNKTHYVAANGNEMNFTWEGPASLGEIAQSGERTLYLYGADVNYQLSAWTYGYVDGDYESCLNMDKTTWTGFAPDDIPYIEDAYYNVETTDSVIKVVFAVGNNEWKGYNYYITDSINGICYQFAYYENVDIYDDNRAMNVINSIEYWNYIPEETTTE